MAKKSIAIIIALFAILTIITGAFADSQSEVIFNGASGFVFNPENGDLFQDFKNMMPGDTKEQHIVIQNTSENKPVTIYLKAKVSEEYKDFFDFMTISVYKSYTASTLGTLIAENKASEEGVLLNNTSLGEYRKGSIGYLTVLLKIDESMDNDYMFKEGIIKWTFTAEEDGTTQRPTEPPTKPTQTNPLPPDTTKHTSSDKPVTTLKPYSRPSTTKTVTTRKEPITLKPTSTQKDTPADTLITTRKNAPVINNIPDTGSANTLPVSIVCLGALSLASIILVKNKKKKEENR